MWALAGRYILQKVSGQPFAKYVEDKLHPLGMDNSSFDMAQIRANPTGPSGIPTPSEGAAEILSFRRVGYTPANDMARFIQFHLNRGSVNGQSVLSPALLDEMYTVPAPTQGSPEGYALGVARSRWHRNRETELLAHGGGGFGFLADLYWFPELKIGITVLTNSTDHNLQGDLARQIVDDFVHDPNSVYYSRLMALPDRAPERW
jgi:CubicO group peptidase (beta-lactamase class C family)